MARIATLYYLEEQSQAEIAERFGLSRIKVGRMLKAARETGLVEIRIHAPAALSLDMETELKRRFALRQALLAGDQDSEEADRSLVGEAAANYLSMHLRAGSVVALGMGRNVAAVASSAARDTTIDCTFVTAIGGSADIAPGLNSGDICRQFAASFGARSEILYAPAYAGTRELRDSLLGVEGISRIKRLAAEAQIAIVGIGDARPESAVVQLGWFAPDDMREMTAAGAVGDILGHFFDREGKAIVPGMSERVVGVSADELRRIPCVIGVAAEDGKAESLLGALRSGILDVLATTAGNACRIIEMDGAD